MNQVEVIKRQIRLKRQALTLIKQEITDLQLRLVLVIMKGRLENQTDKGFDPALSRKLDCINYLLEN